MEPSVDQYKSGSTITLSHYNTKLSTMLPPRSAKLLSLRGPAFPAQSLDLSAELATENHVRRTMHQAILEKDPSAFRKKERAESASSAVHNRQLVKDLLGDMHQLKDARDIDKSKKFTRSLLFEKEQQKTMSLNEYHFNTMSPLEDFVRPDDQFSPRSTGYEHGHIRSLLKLDVYGPAASAAVEKEREAGALPRSPNVDRHVVLNPNHTLTLRGSVHSPASSRASTANSTSYNGAFPSLKTLRKDRAVVDVSSSMDTTLRNLNSTGRRDHPERTRMGTGTAMSNASQFGASTGHSEEFRLRMEQSYRLNAAGRPASSSDRAAATLGRPGGTLSRSASDYGGAILMAADQPGVEFSGPGLRPMTSTSASTRTSAVNTRPNSMAGSRTGTARSRKAEEQTFQGVAITEEERLLGGDPFLRRTTWYKTFASDQKARAVDRETYKQEMREAREQQQIAEQERKRMKDFDDYLVLAKYNP